MQNSICFLSIFLGQSRRGFAEYPEKVASLLQPQMLLRNFHIWVTSLLDQIQMLSICIIEGLKKAKIDSLLVSKMFVIHCRWNMNFFCFRFVWCCLDVTEQVLWQIKARRLSFFECLVCVTFYYFVSKSGRNKWRSLSRLSKYKLFYFFPLSP